MKNVDSSVPGFDAHRAVCTTHVLIFFLFLRVRVLGDFGFRRLQDALPRAFHVGAFEELLAVSWKIRPGAGDIPWDPGCVRSMGLSFSLAFHGKGLQRKAQAHAGESPGGQVHAARARNSARRLLFHASFSKSQAMGQRITHARFSRVPVDKIFGQALSFFPESFRAVNEWGSTFIGKLAVRLVQVM